MNREHAWITIKCFLARPAAAGCSLPRFHVIFAG
jgi:hypothetical protein